MSNDNIVHDGAEILFVIESEESTLVMRSVFLIE